MLAFREWRVGWHVDEGRPMLFSLYVNEPWPEAVKVADGVPAPWGMRGIHAYVEGRKLPAEGARDGAEVLVRGAIDAHGRVVEHGDGVIRAERARILALRIVDEPGGFAATPCRFCGLSYRVKQVEYCAGDRHLCGDCPHIDLGELEELLLKHYGVPRLPEGVGPWQAGAGS